MKKHLINITSVTGFVFLQMILIFCINGCFNTSESIAQKNENKMPFKVNKSEEEWKKELSDEQFRVLREKGTERAFTGKYDKFYEEGSYKCAGCGTELFSSDTKYDSGCGWPAFYYADSSKIKYIEDKSYGMIRTEVVCANCGGHLGHVFPDGPKDKTGIRYCINSVSLEFVKDTTNKD